MSVQSALGPEVHRASCIHGNDSNKCVEYHVSDTSGNTGDILSRKLPVQFPWDVDCTDISNVSAISYCPLMCVIPCAHTLGGQGDSDVSHLWR